jgi:hypothetical protein
MDLLKQQGVTINPEALANANLAAQALPPAAGQPPHGGKVPQMASLDKHQADQTFGMQGSGVATPQGTVRPIQ